MKDLRESLAKVFAVIGGVFAIIVAAVWIVQVLNTTFEFLSSAPHWLLVSMEFVLRWATLILVASAGLAFTLKRNIVIRIIFYLLIVALIIIHFFPGVYEKLISFIPGQNGSILFF